MDVAALGTSMSQYQTQTDHAVKVTSMVKDQIEQNGEMALQLIQSAAPVAAPDPTSSLGQNIDIRV
ncbi:YjfB family protein [Marinobacterium stanieri]|uniref:Putative motility protein n=1 Tax=Marinobacterium stanieri TaxID=49186 RepID=A0A1N6UL88_9GAMM|nr:YjfB family protein [Marinobacterium stanieri]SIQ66374.1 Putative motility protein [Marinobacterium stanieri]